jgi:hypothetical protein
VTPVVEFRRLTATLIFDLEDSYARSRGVAGPHPRPMGSVAYSIIGRTTAGNRQLFAIPLKLAVKRNPSGYDLFFGELAGAPGETLTAGLSDGTYIVRVDSQFYQGAERDDIVVPTAFAPKSSDGPGQPWFFDLSPNYAYPFPDSSTLPGGLGPTLLRGVVRAFDGTGLAGAAIQVVGKSNLYTTDPSGQWVLVFSDNEPSGDVTVHFALRDGTARDVVVPIVQGRDNSLPQTALRGWAMAAGTGLAGVRIQITGQLGQVVTGADGSWFYYFDLNQMARVVSVAARSTDGRPLTQDRIVVQPRATVIVPSFLF